MTAFSKDPSAIIVTEQRSQAIGTLANNAGILIGTKLAITKDFRMLKSQIYANYDTLPTEEGSGLLFGLAAGVLSLAEIEEALENNGPLNPVGQVNFAMRPVWILGALEQPKTATATEGRVLNENAGAMIEVKPRWTFQETLGWNFFVYNQGQTMTGNAVIRILVKNWGLFLR